ncbi:hypothetical protein C6497_14570 [Candidatus Poribacteria bacterium]|nr:MAG: hypothetical protein C6497_14570 [Candidatus Poribacteria bacterium]
MTENSSKSLFLTGGITGILAALLMIFTGFMFMFHNSDRPDIMHGVSVVMMLLIVPTLVATTVLVLNEARTGTLIGIAFATLWVILELIAHLTQTSPLKIVLGQAVSQHEFGSVFTKIWLDLNESLTLTAGFTYAIMALCFGFSIGIWGNTGSAFLLIISAISFAIPFIPGVNFNIHILIRGLAFLFLSGVLMQASRETNLTEWED